MRPYMSCELPVCEIFDSIEGEGKRAGVLATFIRLAGCNLRCKYCDTTYAFTGGEPMSIEDIAAKVHYNRVTLTGGEPLIHDIRPLLDALSCREVNIETNGSINVEPLFMYPQVFFTIDYKCGASGMSDKMCDNNFRNMRKRDVLKFVVGSREDLEQVLDVYKKYYSNLRNRRIYLSPVFGEIEPSELVDFLKKHNLWTWHVQLQMHKFIWDPNKRGV